MNAATIQLEITASIEGKVKQVNSFCGVPIPLPPAVEELRNLTNKPKAQKINETQIKTETIPEQSLISLPIAKTHIYPDKLRKPFKQ